MSKYDIEKLDLKQGDVVVAKFPETLTMQSIAEHMDTIKKTLPAGVNLIGTRRGVDVEVTRPEEGDIVMITTPQAHLTEKEFAEFKEDIESYIKKILPEGCGVAVLPAEAKVEIKNEQA